MPIPLCHPLDEHVHADDCTLEVASECMAKQVASDHMVLVSPHPTNSNNKPDAGRPLSVNVCVRCAVSKPGAGLMLVYYLEEYVSTDEANGRPHETPVVRLDGHRGLATIRNLDSRVVTNDVIL